MTHTSIGNLGPCVFENIVDGVILLTCDGTVAYVNKSARSMLSIGEDQLNQSLPGVWLQQAGQENDEFCQAILDALYDKHELISRKVGFQSKNGERRTLWVKSSYWNAPNRETQDGILLIVQDITAEERLKKEKADAILVLSVFIAIVGIWTLFYSALVNFGVQLPGFVMTYILLGMGAILAGVIIWKTDLKAFDMGLSFRNIRKPVLVNVCASLFACLALIAAKFILIRNGSEFFPDGQPFFDFRFTLGMKLYPLSVMLQETLSQSVIHESLMRILEGKRSHIFAILLSAVLFTALHIHRGFGFMIGSLLLVCVIGIMYRRQRTIWGICITHYSVSMMAFFLNWL